MSVIKELLSLVIIIALFNTCVLVCFKKWKWLDWYSIRRMQWMPKADCYLCISFWISSLQMCSLFIQGTVTSTAFLLLPFCASPLTNYLTNIAVLHDYNKNR